MIIGVSYDLKESVSLGESCPEDALEEYDSPATVDAIAGALAALGHSVVTLGGGRELVASLLRERVDLVFNIAEGRGNYRSREAQVPSILEMLEIPYTGSDPQCLAICLDKPLTKKLVELAGIRTPRWRLVEDSGQLGEQDWDGFPLPAFVKPAWEGSSKGIRLGSRVEHVEQLFAVARRVLREYDQPALVEEFIGGDEITVGVVGNSPPSVIGIMRVLPRSEDPGFAYSLEVKRDWEELVDYECPARLDGRVSREIVDFSLGAFEALGCRDIARADFRLGPGGEAYFLEINPLPGLNPHSSDLPILNGKMGRSYRSLIAAIIEATLERYKQCVPVWQ